MTEEEELLADVKNYLDITWDDIDTNKKISGIIKRGESYLNYITGAELNYTEEGKARELLFDYCLYVRSGKLAEFQNDYLSELLTLQMKKGMEFYAESTDV